MENSSVVTPTTENLDIYIVQYAKTDALSKANEGFKQALQDSNVSCNFTEQNTNGNSQSYKVAIDKAVSNKETKAVLIGKWHADFTNATDAYEVIIPESISDDEAYQIGYEAGLSFVVGANLK